MSTTVQQLAELVSGRVVGDGSQPIVAARPLGEACSGDITFVENEQPCRAVSRLPGVRRRGSLFTADQWSDRHSGC